MRHCSPVGTGGAGSGWRCRHLYSGTERPDATIRKGRPTTLTSTRAADRAQTTVAIRRPDDGRILVLADGTLPTFEAAAAEPWQDVRSIGGAMRDALGMQVDTLRAAWVSETADARLYEAAWIAGHVSRASEWVSQEDLANRFAGPPALVAAIAGGALEPASGELQPWYVPGWLDGMIEWIDGRLADRGLHRRGSVRQIRSWGRSSLLQADTDRGLVWAKQVPLRFAHEISVTGLLADLDPGLVPPILAADPGAGRLLLAHVEGPLLSAVTDEVVWTATLARLAETQRVLSVERDRLSVAGVAAAPLSTLAAEVPALLADDELSRVGQPGGLSPAVAALLRTRTAAIADACDALAATGIPDSLDHGDLSASQVIVGEMGPVIFDWSDASITHPFLSLAAFLDGRADALPRRADLERAYAGPWAGAADAATISSASQLATIAMPIHLARVYRDRVLPGFEQPWEVDRVVPAALRSLAGALAVDQAAR